MRCVRDSSSVDVEKRGAGPVLQPEGKTKLKMNGTKPAWETKTQQLDLSFGRAVRKVGDDA